MLLALTLAGCGLGPSAPARRAPAIDRCRYDVRVETARPLVLDVTATCSGRAFAGLSLSDAAQLPYVEAPSVGGRPLRRNGLGFELPRAVRRASIRYRVRLDAAARDEARVDFAIREGDGLLAPASTFLLHPLPLEPDVPVTVHVETPPGVEFRTGLEREGDHYRLAEHEIPVATYAAFGTFASRSVAVGDARIELVVLDSQSLLSTDVLAAWLEARARLVAAHYRSFPAKRVSVFVVPVREKQGVVFGQLLPQSSPAVVIRLGTLATERDLAEDWVLIHELFHLGVPSFYREGKWFDEGLATYFEPILRVRAGLLTERSLWTDFARDMPKGLDTLTRYGLEHAPDYAGVYWGGAAFCLLADAEIRESTGQGMGLEDGMRAVFESGGSALDVWSLDTTLRIADGLVGEPVLARLSARYAKRPAPFDLEQLLARLGVRRRGAGEDVDLDDAAPLAAVRRAIVHPPSAAPGGRPGGSGEASYP